MFRRTSPPTEAASRKAPTGDESRNDDGWRARLERAFARLRAAFEERPALRRLAIGIALGTTFLVLLGALGIGPLVRRRIAVEAQRRKVDIEVGSIRPGFFSLSLRDVHVRPSGSTGIEVVLDDVRVELGASFSARSIDAKGGRVAIEGELDDVNDRLRALRGKDDEGASAASSAQKRLSAEGLSLMWKVPSGGEVSGAGLRATRADGIITLGCAQCSARYHERSAEVTDAEVEVAHGAARRISLATFHLEDSAPTATPAAPPTATSAVAEPAPPPLPTVRKRGAPLKAPVPEVSEEAILPLPDLHALRAKISTAVTTAASRLPDGGRVEIKGLSAKWNAGREPIAFGPGPLVLERRADRIHMTFSSAADAEHGKAPLSIDADLPLAKGDLTARLAGGPVSLAALGVKEGMRGLSDVAHGTISGKGQLVLSEAADALTFDGEVALRSLSLKQARLSPEPLRGIEFSVSARGVLDDHGKLRLDDGQLDMGALHLRTHGVVEEAPDHFGVSLAIDVLPAACQALFDSAPQGLLPLVRSARMTGTFSAGVNLAFDTRAIDKLALDYRIGDECRMAEVPAELSRDRFEDAFSYRTYRPDGTVGETTTGPGTTNWTALDDISPFMISALLTTEDGAFYKHKGFNHAAIRSSIQANLKARRFVRGASTITMQLAKNLFLSRDKALSRKIEEVILTDYLEQIFRKDDMMELYLNVVEFGPDIYGITQAANYYFGRKPEELHVGECFFLASLLPSPIRYGKLREAGEVSENWMRHLKALMQIAEKNGKITQAELEEGLKEPIVFVRNGDSPPAPRKPVTSSRRNPGDDDDAWRPLD